MKLFLRLSICLSLLHTAGCATHSKPKPPSQKRQREIEARTAATHWLELVDETKYARAYKAETARLHAATTEGQFIRSMEGRRVPFGRVLSRKFIGAAFTRKLTGSPDGLYESILFRTSFEHKKTAAERVILSKEEGQWRVVDYRVY